MLMISYWRLPVVRACSQVGPSFVDHIWFSLLIVDAAIYAAAHSSRWRSKNLVLPLISFSSLVSSHQQWDLLWRLPDLPAESQGSETIPVAQMCTESLKLNGNAPQICMYLHVYPACQNGHFQPFPDRTGLEMQTYYIPAQTYKRQLQW